MQSPKISSSSPFAATLAGLVRQTLLVFIVGGILATLFTLWTPGQFHSIEAPATLNSSLAQRSTQQIAATPGGPTKTPRSRLLVGIVAGHWKNDSGAVCPDGLKEVDINLNIATLVQKKLVENGFDVDLLGEFDVNLSGYQAAALVSIHNDSCDYINNQASGFKVVSAMATKHPERAARLTACLRNRYASQTGMALHSTSVTPDMTSYHAFAEIEENTPAAIIETGFMNLDRQFLTQRPDLAALGIANGILCFIRNESITPPVTPTIITSPVP